MSVRPFADDDARPVAELIVRAWARDYAPFVPRERMPSVENREAQLMVAAQQFELWVADDDGDAVGVTGVEDDAVKLLYVDPGHQGRGVGATLLARAESAVRRGGHRRGRLWVFRDNTAGRRFYERWGWRPDGTEQQIWPGVFELRYARDL